MFYKSMKKEFNVRDIIISFFVICIWQSLFTIFDKYIGGKVYINIVLLIVSIIVIYKLTGNVKLF